MNSKSFMRIALLTSGWLLFVFVPGMAQQQDVPEPVFMNFSIQPLYIPSYHGRDPFKPLDNMDRSPQVTIAELEFHGIILMGETPMALFTWRGNSNVSYVLKFRKLYGGENIVDGVVGEITTAAVVLVQGDQKIVYPRK
jgi:hypothetical protein